MDEKRSNLMPVVVAVFLALPVLYVGSYLALVIPEGRMLSDDPFDVGHYRIGGDQSRTFFWPLERLDQQVRPARWGIVYESGLPDS